MVYFSDRKGIEDGEWLLSGQFFKERLKAVRGKQTSYDSRQ